MTNFYNSQGLKVELGEMLGKGGEGEIFALNGQLAAKVFHLRLATRKAPKIVAMVKTQSPDLLKVAAWPVDTLHTSVGGPVVGAIMPRVRSHWDIHELYNPQSRRIHFPRADWRFLLRVAANLGRAFAVVHRSGHVVGDINFKNVVVYRDATVTLLDCDSFQIDSDGERFLCEVGVPEFTPPELLSVGSDTTMAGVRTCNHDNFGLAVLIFHLLFLGRHPFTGLPVDESDMSIDRAIRERRFAYGSGSVARGMMPPPSTLPLEAVPSLVRMFEDAFVATDSIRPGAADWMSALEGLLGSRRGGNLRLCTHSNSHYYVSTLPNCPWCELEDKTKYPIFGFERPRNGLSLRQAFEVARKVPAPETQFRVACDAKGGQTPSVSLKDGEDLLKLASSGRFDAERKNLAALSRRYASGVKAPTRLVKQGGDDAANGCLPPLLILLALGLSGSGAALFQHADGSTMAFAAFLFTLGIGFLVLAVVKGRQMQAGELETPVLPASEDEMAAEVMKGVERLLSVREEIMRARDTVTLQVDASRVD